MSKNLVVVFCILAVFALGCGKLQELSKGGGGAAFKSESDNFTIAFPSGASDVKEEPADLKYTSNGKTYGKMFDNRSDNYRSYEITAADMSTYPTDGKTERDIEEIALNGWEDEPETEVKETTIDGLKALDSVRSVEIGPAKMTFREVPIWDAKGKKLYTIQVAAVKKENVMAKEANDFINSFKLLKK
jgi:hypothetical protein